MKEYCILTGQEITENGIEPIFKKMCLNCTTCIIDDEKYRCTNEKVMEIGKKKILENLPDGFEVESISLKPMELKDPTKKCNKYVPDIELIETKVKEFFLTDEGK